MATINSSTGALTVSATSETEEKVVCTVQLSVTMNGKTGTATASVSQSGSGTSYEYGTPSVSLEYPIIPATGGDNILPTYSYSQTWKLVADATGETLSSGTYSGSDSSPYSGASLTFSIV